MISETKTVGRDGLSDGVYISNAFCITGECLGAAIADGDNPGNDANDDKDDEKLDNRKTARCAPK